MRPSFGFNVSTFPTFRFTCGLVCAVALSVFRMASAGEEPHLVAEHLRIVHETSVIENAAYGTVVESLQNRYPELSNFELIPERRELPVQLSIDGEITVVRPSQLNFEERSLWILTLKAKARRELDPYLSDFLQSLAEASRDKPLSEMEELCQRDVIVSVRLHVVDQEESPRLLDERIDIAHDFSAQQIASIRVIERDRADKLTFSLRCATSNQLRVDPDTGVVSILDPSQMDWQKGGQSLEVEVRDQCGNCASSVLELTCSEPNTGSQAVPMSIAAEQTDESQLNAEIETVTEKHPLPNLHHLRGAFVTEVDDAAILSRDHRTKSTSITSEKKRGDTQTALSSRTSATASDPTQRKQTESGQSLDDAARAINSAAGSPVALNERDHSDVADAESSRIGLDHDKIINAGPEKKDLPPEAVDGKLVQIAIVVVALICIGAVVYVMYRRAQKLRLEVMQRASADAEARLDQYMNGPISDDSESESSSDDSSIEESTKAPSGTVAIDSDFDPGASFDPESLFDGMQLTHPAPSESHAADLNQPPDLSNKSNHAESALEVSTHHAIAESQSPLVFLNEELLVDDILVRTPKPKQDDLFESLQAKLDVLNSRLEQLSSEDITSEDRSSSSAKADSAARLESADDVGCDSATSEKWTSVSTNPEECFEPAYELQWDAEIQRYVKVEKPVERDSFEEPAFSHDPYSPFTGSSVDRPSFTGADMDVSFHPRSTESLACLEEDPNSPADEPPTERVLNLRAELADLFNLHAATTESRLQQTESEATFSEESVEQDVEGKSPEESHLDSVAQYLSQLLERSRKEDDADIFVERRGSPSGKWDGVDRRSKPKPVKSYIESYLETHGGTLRNDMEELAQRPKPEASQSEEAVPPLRDRKPVDVNHLRQSMESFRAVAVRSVETAMASYQVRLAKARLVGRSMLITGLIVIVGLAVGTNVVRNFHLEPLNWLVCAFILLCIAEFFLRVESIRKRRRELRLRILNVQKPANKNPEKTEDESQSESLANPSEEPSSDTPTVTVL